MSAAAWIAFGRLALALDRHVWPRMRTDLPAELAAAATREGDDAVRVYCRDLHVDAATTPAPDTAVAVRYWETDFPETDIARAVCFRRHAPSLPPPRDDGEADEESGQRVVTLLGADDSEGTTGAALVPHERPSAQMLHRIMRLLAGITDPHHPAACARGATLAVLDPEQVLNPHDFAWRNSLLVRGVGATRHFLRAVGVPDGYELAAAADADAARQRRDALAALARERVMLVPESFRCVAALAAAFQEAEMREATDELTYGTMSVLRYVPEAGAVLLVPLAMEAQILHHLLVRAVRDGVHPLPDAGWYPTRTLWVGEEDGKSLLDEDKEFRRECEAAGDPTVDELRGTDTVRSVADSAALALPAAVAHALEQVFARGETPRKRACIENEVGAQ